MLKQGMLRADSTQGVQQTCCCISSPSWTDTCLSPFSTYATWQLVFFSSGLLHSSLLTKPPGVQHWACNSR